MGLNSIFIIASITIAAIGFLVGFGRALKWATKGIFGVVISIIVCVMLGGMVMGIEVINSFVVKMNSYFSGFWEFLNVISLGTIIYYVCFFLVVQVFRVIIVKIVASVLENENKIMKVINKILGGIFFPAFCLGLLLLVFAVIRHFGDSAIALNLIEKIDGSFLMTLYDKNPIVF